MNHRVTVGADGAKVFDRVNYIRLADDREWDEMVYVDNCYGLGSIDGLERHVADFAAPPVVLNAFLSGRPIPLVCVHMNPTNGAFEENPRRFYFLCDSVGWLFGQEFALKERLHVDLTASVGDAEPVIS